MGSNDRRRRFDLDGDPGPEIDLTSKHLLIAYLFHALGDLILLAPVIAALRDAGARRPIGLLVLEAGKRVFETLDLPIRLHTIAEPTSSRAQEVAIGEELRSFGYDLSVDLTRSIERDARPFLAHAGIDTRLGWQSPNDTPDTCGLSFGTRDIRHLGDRHWSRAAMLPLRCLGVREPRFILPLRENPAASEHARAMFGSGTPRLLVVPGSNQPSRKSLDPKPFVEACQYVLGLGGSVVVSGAPSETSAIEAFAERILEAAAGAGGLERNVSTFTGELPTLFALVKTADLVLSNDTGPMHAAFLLDKPTVAVFSHFSATMWGPPRLRPHHIAVEVDAKRVVAQLDAFSRHLIALIDRLVPLANAASLVAAET